MRYWDCFIRKSQHSSKPDLLGTISINKFIHTLQEISDFQT